MIHSGRAEIAVPTIRLAQMRRDQLLRLVEGREPADLPRLAGKDALPPVRVLSRAAERIAAGEPEIWWLPFLAVCDGVAVGGCAFKGPPRDGCAECLYGIAKSERGRGFATAALRLLVDIAFRRGAREMLAEVEPANVASARTLERCGFARNGLHVAADGVAVARYVLRRDG